MIDLYFEHIKNHPLDEKLADEAPDLIVSVVSNKEINYVRNYLKPEKMNSKFSISNLVSKFKLFIMIGLKEHLKIKVVFFPKISYLIKNLSLLSSPANLREKLIEMDCI
jgi:hypothetical protein